MTAFLTRPFRPQTAREFYRPPAATGFVAWALAPGEGDHRRVLAVLAYLRSTS